MSWNPKVLYTGDLRTVVPNTIPSIIVVQPEFVNHGQYIGPLGLDTLDTLATH